MFCAVLASAHRVEDDLRVLTAESGRGRLHISDHRKGRRPVMLVNSEPYLAAWLALHPFTVC